MIVLLQQHFNHEMKKDNYSAVCKGTPHSATNAKAINEAVLSAMAKLSPLSSEAVTSTAENKGTFCVI